MTMVLYFSFVFLLFFIGDVSTTKGIEEECNYSKGNILDCSERKLKSVPGTFPNNVRVIDLSENEIDKIKSYTFVNLTKLICINLSGNLISKIRNLSFVSLPNLTTLFLDSNMLSLRSFDVKSFDFLPSLVELSIHENGMRNTILTDFPFHLMPNIRRLEFDAFDGFRFENLYKLLPFVDSIKINIRSCCYFLRNYTFSEKSSRQIRKLEVYLTKIEHGALCNLRGLDELIINSFVLADPTDDIFKALSCLKHRNLTMLGIHKIHKAVALEEKYLQPLSTICIKRLLLSDNAITRIDVQAFQTFARRAHCLEELDLSDNSIAIESFIWFFLMSTFQNIKIIRLTHLDYEGSQHYSCSIAECEASDDFHLILAKTIEEVYVTYVHETRHYSSLVFTGTEHLRHLDLSHVTFCLCDVVLQGLLNLQYLDISGWYFLSVKRNFLELLPNLEYFKSRNSFLGKALKNHENFPHFFRNSLKLQHVDLHGNELQGLTSVLFDPLRNSLKTLDLSNNKLENLPLKVHTFFCLEYVDLRHNSIQSMDIEERESLSKASNVKVYLKGNPLLCICDTLPFLLWQNLSRIADFGDLVCSTEYGQSRLIIDFLLHIDDFEQHCLNKKWIFIGTTAAAFVVLLIIFATIYYKFRFTIQYWYLMLKKRINRGQPTTDRFPFLFDAFLAYSHCDWDKISEVVALLENENFNLAIDDKTFIAGKPISENIVDTIDTSRKIVFFVTDNFLKSSWGTYETEMAQMHAIRHTGQHLIIIVKQESIRVDKLPVAIKNIWSKIVCITWPEDNDDTKKQLFHQRLIASIR